MRRSTATVALEVSVDYLVGGEATVSPQLLRHRSLIYDSDDEYLSSAVPFIVEGIERSDSVLVVTAKRQTRLLQDVLRKDALLVEFHDSSTWYGSPGGALKSYREFVRDRYARGAPWIRIVGEPVWAGRSRIEVAEWTRYESMLNLSFVTLPATIVCPYDARSLPDAILAGASHTHPAVAKAGNVGASAAYREPEAFLLSRR